MARCSVGSQADIHPTRKRRHHPRQSSRSSTTDARRLQQRGAAMDPPERSQSVRTADYDFRSGSVVVAAERPRQKNDYNAEENGYSHKGGRQGSHADVPHHIKGIAASFCWHTNGRGLARPSGPATRTQTLPPGQKSPAQEGQSHRQKVHEEQATQHGETSSEIGRAHV